MSIKLAKISTNTVTIAIVFYLIGKISSIWISISRKYRYEPLCFCIRVCFHLVEMGHNAAMLSMGTLFYSFCYFSKRALAIQNVNLEYFDNSQQIQQIHHLLYGTFMFNFEEEREIVFISPLKCHCEQTSFPLLSHAFLGVTVKRITKKSCRRPSLQYVNLGTTNLKQSKSSAEIRSSCIRGLVHSRVVILVIV